MEWTFACLEGEWVHESFTTKEEAIQEAKNNFDHTCLVGQLIETDKLVYMVENIEEVSL